MAGQMNHIGRERGWSTYTRDSYDSARTFTALFTSEIPNMSQKNRVRDKNLGLTRFMMYNDFSSSPHRDLRRRLSF